MTNDWTYIQGKTRVDAGEDDMFFEMTPSPFSRVKEQIIRQFIMDNKGNKVMLVRIGGTT